MNRLLIEQKTEQATGVSAPVFLCHLAHRTQVFVEGGGQLEVSYDPRYKQKFNSRKAQWISWPCEADELVAPFPTACRVRGANTTLKIEQFFSPETACTNHAPSKI